MDKLHQESTSLPKHWFLRAVPIGLVVSGLLLVVVSNVMSRSLNRFGPEVMLPRSFGFVLAISGLAVFLVSNIVARTERGRKAKAAKALASLTEETGITKGVLSSLYQTRPWVLLLGGIWVILGGFTVLSVGLFILRHAFAARVPLISMVFTFVYLFLAVLCCVPGVFLLRYAGKIRDLVQTPSAVKLEEALNEQKSFWKFVCIATLVFLGIYLLGAMGVTAVRFSTFF